MDLQQHLIRQMAFSHATFGPGQRTAGVIDHIRKELIEVAKSDPEGAPEEWVDVVILALDGLTRSLAFASPLGRANTDDVAEKAVRMICEKQARNEGRTWPDWRTAPLDQAIEHNRGETVHDGR